MKKINMGDVFGNAGAAVRYDLASCLASALAIVFLRDLIKAVSPVDEAMDMDNMMGNAMMGGNAKTEQEALSVSCLTQE